MEGVGRRVAGAFTVSWSRWDSFPNPPDAIFISFQVLSRARQFIHGDFNPLIAHSAKDPLVAIVGRYLLAARPWHGFHGGSRLYRTMQNTRTVPGRFSRQEQTFLY